MLVRMLALVAALTSHAAAAPRPNFGAFSGLFDGDRAPAGAPSWAIPAPPAAPSSLTAAQSEALDAVFAEVPASARAWPGYDFLGKPFLLIVSDGSAVLVGHPAPPPDYRRVVRNGRTAFVSDRGPNLGFAYDKRYVFAGVETTAVQASTAGHLSGASTIVALALHERFHDYQRQRGWDALDEYSLESVENVALAGLENRALYRWVKTGNEDAMRDFMAVRVRRRALFPETAAEDSQENGEGTALYIEMAGLEAAGDRAVTAQRLESMLDRPAKIDEMSKWRLYDVGAVQCRFLESVEPGAWQPQVEAGRNVSALTAERLALPPGEAASRVARLTAGADYAALVAAARASLKDVTAKRDALRAAFEAEPGMRVRWTLERGGHPAYSGFWFDFPDGAMVFQPDQMLINVKGASSRLRLEGVRALWLGKNIEFNLPPGGIILVDGAPWTPSVGARRFARLELTGSGASLTVADGRLEYDGRVLKVLPGSAP